MNIREISGIRTDVIRNEPIRPQESAIWAYNTGPDRQIHKPNSIFRTSAIATRRMSLFEKSKLRGSIGMKASWYIGEQDQKPHEAGDTDSKNELAADCRKILLSVAFPFRGSSERTIGHGFRSSGTSGKAVGYLV